MVHRRRRCPRGSGGRTPPRRCHDQPFAVASHHGVRDQAARDERHEAPSSSSGANTAMRSCSVAPAARAATNASGSGTHARCAPACMHTTARSARPRGPRHGRVEQSHVDQSLPDERRESAGSAASCFSHLLKRRRLRQQATDGFVECLLLVGQYEHRKKISRARRRTATLRCAPRRSRGRRATPRPCAGPALVPSTEPAASLR